MRSILFRLIAHMSKCLLLDYIIAIIPRFAFRFKLTSTFVMYENLLEVSLRVSGIQRVKRLEVGMGGTLTVEIYIYTVRNGSQMPKTCLHSLTWQTLNDR